ncbi:LamG domain-containing protein [Flavobacterium sediminis]|uniref:LamG domain-containing protein n=1 Tax=Flavobacterium sediminis TaxID=2201181 RepID=UPI001FECD66B|nr:LamG domain-containing protein [Flavobacterium sediminis]
MSFENSFDDEKSGIINPTSYGNVSFVSGIKGNAYQGATDAYVKYEDVATQVSDLQSMTVSTWINTTQHTGGAQALYMLPKTSGFWGNNFMLIEGTSTDMMTLKVHFQKNVTPSIPYAEQWLVNDGTNALADMYGNQWKHITWTYNADTSKYHIYVDGTDVTPAAIINRYTNDPDSGGTPLGALSFADVQNFVLGGYQQFLGSPWSAPDSWMLPYTGAMDEFRIYNVALSQNDINALYQLERQGR